MLIRIPAFDPVDLSKLEKICVCSICVTSLGCIQKNVQNPPRKSLENPNLIAGMSLYNCPNDDQPRPFSSLGVWAPIDRRNRKEDARLTGLKDTSQLLQVAQTSTQCQQGLVAVAWCSVDSLRVSR
jgi:hypothetical protein